LAEILVTITHGPEDPDRAVVGLVVARAAAMEGHGTHVFLTADGALLARRGVGATVRAPGFPPADELLDDLAQRGAELIVCPPCAEARGVTAEHLIAGAAFGGGARVVAILAAGAGSVSF
jgi:predicted peroxiredoxin